MFNLLKQLRQIRKEKAELREMKKSIERQMDELYAVINTAKQYLALCGYTEEDLEELKRLNKLIYVKFR